MNAASAGTEIRKAECEIYTSLVHAVVIISSFGISIEMISLTTGENIF